MHEVSIRSIVSSHNPLFSLRFFAWVASLTSSTDWHAHCMFTFFYLIANLSPSRDNMFNPVV